MKLTVPLLLLVLLGCPSSSEPPDQTPGPCTASDPAEATGCVDAEAYSADLNLLAIPRSPGTAGWQTAQDHCRTVLTELGFDVEDHGYGTGTNIVGTKTGTGSARRTVVISAHYDSVEGCAGADDNASGVAGALGVARALAAGTWDHDLVVACWDEEERGLIGSEAWVARAATDGMNVDSAVSLEMIAYRDDAPNTQELPSGFDLVFPDAYAEVEAREFRGDFITLIGDSRSALMLLAYAEYAPTSLPVVSVEIPDSLLGSAAISDLRRSDHASFWDEEMPGLMVTDTANFRNDAYHCGATDDTVARLDLAFAVDVTRATAAAAAHRLNAL